jgi:hypothetical protein
MLWKEEGILVSQPGLTRPPTIRCSNISQHHFGRPGRKFDRYKPCPHAGTCHQLICTWSAVVELGGDSLIRTVVIYEEAVDGRHAICHASERAELTFGGTESKGW